MWLGSLSDLDSSMWLGSTCIMDDHGKPIEFPPGARLSTSHMPGDSQLPNELGTISHFTAVSHFTAGKTEA